MRSWITRPDDPGFWERAADSCGLYLVPPTNALVLSVDEKTGMPARGRTRPTTRPAPGRPTDPPGARVPPPRHRDLAGRPGCPGRRDLHRDRSGPQHRRQLHRVLDELDAKVPAGLEVHLVLEGGSSHIARDTRWWFVDHPRFHPHYTPTHASWLKQVERFFSILARRLRKRGEFRSVEDLVARVMAFIADDNRTARPFRWTYDGRPLKPADMPTTNAELY